MNKKKNIKSLKDRIDDYIKKQMDKPEATDEEIDEWIDRHLKKV